MQSVEIDGEKYYLDFNENVVYDSSYIEVDVSTRDKVIQQYSQQSSQHKNSTFFDSPLKIHIDNKIVNDQKHKQDFLIVQKPTCNKAKHVSEKKDIESNNHDRVKPNPVDYGINDIIVEQYRKQKKEYDERYNHICYEIRQYKEEKSMFFGSLFVLGLFSFIGFLVVLYAIFGESWETIITLLIISEIITLCVYYNKKVPVKPSQLEITYNFRFNKKDQVEKYLSDLDKYKEDMKQSERDYWNNMGGFEFEKAVAELFRKYGATAIVTPKVGDHGIDIEAEYKGVRYAIQCKHHWNQVGPAPLRELRGVLDNGFEKGIFVSLNGYSTQAYEENTTTSKPLILLTREKLMRINELRSLDEFLNV